MLPLSLCAKNSQINISFCKISFVPTVKSGSEAGGGVWLKVREGWAASPPPPRPPPHGMLSCYAKLWVPIIGGGEQAPDVMSKAQTFGFQTPSRP